MAALTLRDPETCRWDAVSLGEVMLRLDPGDARVRTARSFTVWEGGGEYNVTRALSRVFGLRTATVTALADNEVGRLLEERILAGGVDTRHITWVPYDGVGLAGRVGLNFTERGYGIRPARGVYDRGHTAVSGLGPGDVDWDRIFGAEGARWLHTGGIMAALSPSTAELVAEAVRAARAHGTVVSYDLNYREGLWRDQGGQDRAVEVNRAIAPFVDVMIGNEEDFTAALGFEVAGVDADLADLDPSGFSAMIDQVVAAYPQLSAVATTLRGAHTALRNDWGAVLWADGTLAEARRRAGLEIYDRVGGGDGFASGLIYGLLTGATPAEAVELGAAHGALTMTTPGDTSMVSVEEVRAAVHARTARVVR